MRAILLILIITLLLGGIWEFSHDPPAPRDELVAKGRELFFNETFEGNGRTCGTCHPASNNFTIDRAFIAALPADDPLFVAETDPGLNEHFENPVLMRQFGLIIENLDGFHDLPRVFTMRSVPHTLGLSRSVNSADGPRTGWSGDGAPGDQSLRSFATGAVIQHFTKTTNRIPGVDFRLPTDEELDALEAFQLSLGRTEELELPLHAVDVAQPVLDAGHGGPVEQHQRPVVRERERRHVAQNHQGHLDVPGGLRRDQPVVHAVLRRSEDVPVAAERVGREVGDGLAAEEQEREDGEAGQRLVNDQARRGIWRQRRPSSAGAVFCVDMLGYGPEVISHDAKLMIAGALEG
jgi:hypothetical protein